MGVKVSKKQVGWERALINYIRENAAVPFRPGKMDCGLFFGGSVQAMTGEDINKPFRGKYRTIDGAMKIANKLGFADHVEYVANLYPEIPPLMAQRGDGAVVNDVQGAPALGIVQGAQIYVMTLQGLSLAPLTAAVRGFRI
jgi:hypothetical protein